MRGYLLALSICFALAGCQKDGSTHWLSENRFPLIESKLFLNDFIADSLLESEDGALILAIQREVFRLTLDSLFTIPSDTTVKSFDIPVLQIELPAGATLLDETEIFSFDDMDTQLRLAEIRTGLLRIRATNTIASRMLFTYEVPGASLDGQPVNLTIEVPAAVGDEQGEVDITVELDNYLFDLTGNDGNGFNSLVTRFRLRTPEDIEGVIVTNQDQVSLEAIYTDISISYAEGYFGNEVTEIDNDPINLDVLEPFTSANLILPEASAQIILTNGFGADFRAQLATFSAINSTLGSTVQLEGPLTTGPINLTRATQQGGLLQPQSNSLLLNQDNSNIHEFLANIPNVIEVEGAFEINPLGNISNFNDFLTDASSLTMDVDLRIPLRFALDGLILRDTTDFGNDLDENIIEGSLYVAAQNFFPLQAKIGLFLLKSDGTEVPLNAYLLDNQLMQVESGYLEVDGDGEQRAWKYELPAGVVDELRLHGRVVIEVRLESNAYPELVVIREDQFVDVKISTQGIFSIHVD